MKSLIVFDLDGTLAESKQAMDAEMAELIRKMLAVVRVAVISGGGWDRFQAQFLPELPDHELLKNLAILPTCGTAFYEFTDSWQKLYSEDLSEDQKKKIIDALNKAKDEAGIHPPKLWGEQIEDRGSQITFSGLGQQAPLDEKTKWDPDMKKRQQMEGILNKLLPDFSVRIGGSTSIDITEPGIDKAYGIKKLEEVFKLGVGDLLYIGDAIFPGGNDYPVVDTGVDTIHIRDPQETKRVNEAIIACMKPV